MSAGFRAQAYSSGASLLESLDTSPPDCVILDLHMPGMSGFDVQTRLKELGSRSAVVVITGHDSPDAETRTRAAGAVAFLRKPVDDQVLLDAVAIGLAHELKG